MRFVVFGAGAIGGVVGARLHQAGHDVVLLARGRHLEAIRRDGLRLITPDEDETFRIEAAAEPAELAVGRDGDVVLLCVKSQDTLGAAAQLRAAGADEVPIVCLQNGVENERVLLRRFPEVHGAVVIAPTNHLEPGVVEGTGRRLSGVIDLGAYPTGRGALVEAIAAALRASRFDARAVEDVMRLKYSKLLLNLGNVVGALFPAGGDRDALTREVREEGEAVLRAAAIDHAGADVDELDARRTGLAVADIPGRPRGGSSSWQSLARGSETHPPSIETDYLNGEIALLGRLHGVPTPLNAALCRLADDHVRRGGGPGELALADLRAAVTA